jgi:hypothetical protein
VEGPAAEGAPASPSLINPLACAELERCRSQKTATVSPEAQASPWGAPSPGHGTPPARRIPSGCCAPAASGHVMAVHPRRAMNSCRLIASPRARKTFKSVLSTNVRLTPVREIQRRTHPRAVIEAVLNHTSGFRASVAGIYNRATYAKEMREALEAWANHVEALTR